MADSTKMRRAGKPSLDVTRGATFADKAYAEGDFKHSLRYQVRGMRKIERPPYTPLPHPYIPHPNPYTLHPRTLIPDSVPYMI